MPSASTHRVVSFDKHQRALPLWLGETGALLGQYSWWPLPQAYRYEYLLHPYAPKVLTHTFSTTILAIDGIELTEFSDSNRDEGSGRFMPLSLASRPVQSVCRDQKDIPLCVVPERKQPAQCYQHQLSCDNPFTYVQLPLLSPSPFIRQPHALSFATAFVTCARPFAY